MKKTISILLATSMLFTLAACKNQTPTDAASNGAMESSNHSTQNANAADPSQTASAKVLVAYFSCTGTTQQLAEYIADSLSADIHEIIPVDPYTSADLNYSNGNSRSTQEMNDPNSRPAISNAVSDMAQYDIVFIGYPIWWGEAPRIVSTFMENYDFSGKTIVPFCTSGGSGMGSSGTNLERLTEGANWLSGRRFGGGTSRSDMVSWVNSLGLAITANE